MRVKEFVETLKWLNPRIRFAPGPGPSSGLYLFQPKHEDAHPENGWRWIAAIPSPSWFFGSMPRLDFFDHNDQYHRGMFHVMRLLHGQGHFTDQQLIKGFGNKWKYACKNAAIHIPQKFKDKPKTGKANQMVSA